MDRHNIIDPYTTSLHSSSSSSAAVLALNNSTTGTSSIISLQQQAITAPAVPSRYESQKRRDWNTFNHYLKGHLPPLSLSHCSGAHVIEFLKYLDQFGKTKVHSQNCPFFGQPNPPAPCPCPLKQAWGSLDALVGRFRAAFEENGGLPEANPFGARAVRSYLKEVRDHQSKARGVSYEKKKKKKKQQQRNNNLPAPAPAPAGALVIIRETTSNPNENEEAYDPNSHAHAHDAVAN